VPIDRASRAVLAASLALLAPAVAAANLGTLFNTAEERARLDKLRRGEPQVVAQAGAGAASVTGFVKRSDGRSTVWIDGEPIAVNTRAAEPLLDPKSVRGYAPPPNETLKVERKTPR
jgi:hypothetical protein